jgi:hypothetical protein
MFAELEKPEMILVGTSNSSGKLNLDGYLRPFSKVDILNMVETFDGYGGSLQSYLSSQYFKKYLANFIIWKIFGYYNLSNDNYFNELLKLLGKTS